MRQSTLARGIATFTCALWLCGLSVIPANSEERVDVIKLRGGELRLINNDRYQPKAVINGQEFSFGPEYVGHEITFHLSDRDVVVLSSEPGAYETPPFFRILSVKADGVAEEIANPEFDAPDGTLITRQDGDVIYFNLGYESGLKKDAVFSPEGLTISMTPVAHPAYDQDDCEWLYRQALGECVHKIGRSCQRMEHSTSTVRGLYGLQNNPRWKVAESRFGDACKLTCKGKKRPAYTEFAKDVCEP
jgi:hypothetical protein